MATSDDIREVAAQLLTIANKMETPPIHRPPHAEAEVQASVSTPPIHRPGGLSGN